jgi:hypothetical protein
MKIPKKTQDILDKIEWDIGHPLKTIEIYHKTFKDFTGISLKDLSKLKLPIETGNKVHFFPAMGLYFDKYSFLLEPIKGTSIYALLSAIERGLTKKIDPTDLDQIKVAYEMMGYYRYPEDRFKFVRDVERGQLTWRDIVGAHPHFTGTLTRRDGIWTFSTET